MDDDHRPRTTKAATGLRRSVLSTTVATAALATVTGGSAAFALTGGQPLTVVAPPPSAVDTTTPGTTTGSADSGQPAYDPPISVRMARDGQSARTPANPAVEAVAEVPSAALTAYQRAEAVINRATPRCGLEWTLLAAVGRVLTDHGERDGHELDDDGVVEPTLVGATLRTHRGTPADDTDEGALDGDRRADRRVGPMLLAPSLWSVVGVDADADGERDPQDLDDAALAVAVLLCADDGDLSTEAGRRTALLGIDDAPGFVQAVLDVDAGYQEDLRADVVPVEYHPPGTSPTLPTQAAPPTPPGTSPSSPPGQAGDIPGGTNGDTDGDTDGDKDDQAGPKGPGGGDGPSSPPQPARPAPTVTEVLATYDTETDQLALTATVRAEGGAPVTGAVTLQLVDPDGNGVALQPLEVPVALVKGTGDVLVTELALEPGLYEVTASYGGADGLKRSSGSVTLEVLADETEPAAPETTTPAP